MECKYFNKHTKSCCTPDIFAPDGLRFSKCDFKSNFSMCKNFTIKKTDNDLIFICQQCEDEVRYSTNNQYYLNNELQKDVCVNCYLAANEV